MQFRDPRGKRYTTGEPAGKGGEATVFEIVGQPRWLAKIFTDPGQGRESKLAWMIAHPPDDPAARMGHTSISWPVQLLYGENGFAGYLMPHIKDTVPALNVFHPRLRLQTFQRYTRRHLHNTAYNIAAALGAIHDRGYVVGDLNESNVLVARSTLVTLIDTDSFQVRVTPATGPERLHLCVVGKPEYLPPEMQGADLKTTERKPDHDRFALGVLIFQLLMDGNHPFRGRWTGRGERPALPERIKNGQFPYRSPPPKDIEPIGSLDLLHPLIADLFRRCFILGHVAPETRPSPGEWEKALGEVVRTLIPCRQGHFYSPHLDGCPECDREPLQRRTPIPARKPAAKPPESAGQGAPPPPPNFSPAPAGRPQPPTPPAPLQPLSPQSGVTVISNRFNLPPALQRRVRTWMRNNPPHTYVRQPAFWGIAGFLGGSLLGTQIAAVTAGQLTGLLGGLVSGALAGDVVEKKIGWEVFFGGFGALVGIFLWYLFGTTTVMAAWILSAAGGGIAGMLIGRYGRFAELTLLWAASGAAGGWFLGQWAAGLPPQAWLGAGLSGGVMALITGVAYALWRKYG